MFDGARLGEHLLLVELAMRDELNARLRCWDKRPSDTLKVITWSSYRA